MLRSPSTSSRLHARRGRRLLMEVHDMIRAVTCRRVSQMPARARTLSGRTGGSFTSRLTFHSHRKCSLSLRGVQEHQFA